jgi:Flp pilus assembly protein CpaB
VPSDRTALTREPGDDQAQVPAERPKARSPARLTAGSVVPVLLAVLAAAFTYEALQDRSATTSIVVAASSVPAGAPVNSKDTRAVRVHSSDAALTQGLLSPAQLGKGWVAAVALGAGQPVTMSEVEKPSLVSTLGQMSIAVPEVQAAGGRIAAGDLVDVIATNGSGGAYYVAQGLRVLDVAPPSTTTGVLGGASGSYFVVVAVDKQTALRIAAAVGGQEGGVAGNGIEIIRSTGEPATSRTQYGMPAGEPLKVAGSGPVSRTGS